jgi:2-hydroxy-3-keto-5-methylthiopentenyl-1-phosphate phosphatase
MERISRGETIYDSRARGSQSIIFGKKMRSLSTEIYCDFDGTISTPDTVDYILENLADPCWRDMEMRFEAGEISARECMSAQAQLIEGGWAAVEKVLNSVQVHPTFPRFVQWCKNTGKTLYVASDGFDRVIEYVLAKAGLTVDGIWANRLVENESTGKFVLEAPFSVPGCLQGVCKCKLLTRSPANVLKVVIGDGRSDFCWAPEADLLFAKSKLLAHCLENEIAHIAFEDFDSIASIIEQRINTDNFAFTQKKSALVR